MASGESCTTAQVSFEVISVPTTNDTIGQLKKPLFMAQLLKIYALIKQVIPHSTELLHMLRFINAQAMCTDFELHLPSVVSIKYNSTVAKGT